MKNITDEINKRYENLTKSQKIVADFLLENYAPVPLETLNEIVHRIELSTTSLVRFSRMTGYKDYTGLKRNIQDSIRVKVSLPSRFGELSEQGGTPSDSLPRRRNIAVDNIEVILGLQDTGRLDLAINWISNTNHNYVLGLRIYFFPAFYLAVVLSQTKEKTRLIQGVASTYPEGITDVEEGDVCTVFSFLGSYKETVNIAHLMRRRGAKVTIITGKDIKPVKPYGDIIIPCFAVGPSLKDSYAAVHFLTNYIISSITTESKDKRMEVVPRIGEVLSQNYFTGF